MMQSRTNKNKEEIMLPELDISDLSNFWEEVRRREERDRCRRLIEGKWEPSWPEPEIPDEVIPASAFEKNSTRRTRTKKRTN